ncbi:MAG: sulfur carrier protein ThiS [Pseudomonadota bacterium]
MHDTPHDTLAPVDARTDTPPPLVTIRTDQGPLSLVQGSTLAEALDILLAAQGKPADSVATAVNGQFVPRHARATHLLHDDDTVLCFSPITGG